MLYVILTLVVIFLMWRQRTEGVIIVKTQAPRIPFADQAGKFLEDFEQSAQASGRNTGGAKLPVDFKKIAILAMIRKGQRLDAIQLYRRLYNVDLESRGNEGSRKP